jgi:hypothetical protein
MLREGGQFVPTMRFGVGTRRMARARTCEAMQSLVSHASLRKDSSSALAWKSFALISRRKHDSKTQASLRFDESETMRLGVWSEITGRGMTIEIFGSVQVKQ